MTQHNEEHNTTNHQMQHKTQHNEAHNMTKYRIQLNTKQSTSPFYSCHIENTYHTLKARRMNREGDEWNRVSNLVVSAASLTIF